MSKKILSVMLALVLVMSTFVTVAFAAGVSYETIDEETGLSEYTQVWALSEPVDKGNNTYTVDVSLTTNYPTGAIQFQIEEIDDGNVITLDSVALNTTNITYAAEVSKNSAGKVIIVPQTTADASLIEAKAINGVIATLTYTYTGTGSAEIAIKNAPKTEENPAGTLIAARMGDGNIVSEDSVVGQSVVDANGAAVTVERITPVTIGSAAEPADLVLTDTGSTAGVIIDTTHTFGGAYTGVVYGITSTNYKAKTTITNNVTASNEGSLVVTTSDGKTTASGNYGTGATIEVLNSDGTSTGKIYVFVAFGDVDGNGLINGNDAKAVTAAVTDATNAPANSVKRMAGNCQIVTAAVMMHTLNGNDAKAITAHVSGTKLDQVALATKMVSVTNYYV